jgi:hypothetical protein
MSFCGKKGLRVDRVIQCELLKKSQGETLKIQGSFKYLNEKDSYISEYRLDSVKKGT